MSSSKRRVKQVVGLPCYKVIIVLNWKSGWIISAKFVWNPCWDINKHQVEKHEDDLINNYLGWPSFVLALIMVCYNVYLIRCMFSYNILYFMDSWSCTLDLYFDCVSMIKLVMGLLNIALCWLWHNTIVFIINMTSSIHWHG